MAIVVACKCGKKFKVRDELAGRVVKCPGCASPLRIAPAGPAKSAAPAATQVTTTAAISTGEKTAPQVNVEEALLKLEEAKKKKQMSAEEEAAYRDEQNKLVASYDQLSGRKAKEGAKKKGELTEVGIKKPTIFTKIADAFGSVFGTFAFKYTIITVLLAGGVVGSVYLVQFVTGYMAEDTRPQAPKEVRIRELFADAEKAVEEKRWADATQALDEIRKLDPSKEMHRDYQRLRKDIMDAGG